MINSLVHSALVVCFMYFSLTSCKLLDLIELTSIEKLNEALSELNDVQYSGLLQYSIPAASSGKNVFKMPYNPSEDCIRTARVIMQAFARPSTNLKAAYVLYQSHRKAVKTKSSSSHFQELVNLTCKYADQEAKKSPSTFPNFEELKKNVQLPKPKKNYIYKIPSDDIKHWLLNLPGNYDDPELFKYATVMEFLARYNDKNHLDLAGTVRAVHKLSMIAAINSTVDVVFVKALEDYVTEVHSQKINKYAATQHTAFMWKVEQYFLENSELKEAYVKIKKQIILEIEDEDFNEDSDDDSDD